MKYIARGDNRDEIVISSEDIENTNWGKVNGLRIKAIVNGPTIGFFAMNSINRLRSPQIANNVIRMSFTVFCKELTEEMLSEDCPCNTSEFKVVKRIRSQILVDGQKG